MILHNFHDMLREQHHIRTVNSARSCSDEGGFQWNGCDSYGTEEIFGSRTGQF